jgi:hypothetical protein
MSFYQVIRYVGFSIGSGLAVTLLWAFDGGASVPTESAYSKSFAVGAGLCLFAAVIAYAGLDAGSTPRMTHRRNASGRLKRASWPLLVCSDSNATSRNLLKSSASSTGPAALCLISA